MEELTVTCPSGKISKPHVNLIACFCFMQILFKNLRLFFNTIPPESYNIPLISQIKTSKFD